MNDPEDPTTAAKPDRIDLLVAAFHELSALMRQRVESFAVILRELRRSDRIKIGMLGLLLALMVVICSALFSGVPVLRIHEHNQAQTADVIRQLNCGVAWNNGNRFSTCADVFRLLDAQAIHDGIPIPGMSH